MKKLIWLSLLAPTLLLGQVERIGGFPGTIRSLFTYQNELYLTGSGQTRFKYAPEAAGWYRDGEQDYQYKTFQGVDFLLIQDSIWLGFSSGWIIRSLDGGQTASRTLIESRNHSWEAGLWHAGDSLYYCYLNNSLWRSADFGLSFAKVAEAEYLVSAGSVGEYVYYFERTKEELLLQRSKDNFVTVERVNIPPILRRSPIKVSSFKDQIVLSNHEKGLVYISPDQGLTWRMGVVDSTIAELVRPDYSSRSARYQTVAGDQWVNEFYSVGDTLFISANDGLYHSVNDQLSAWTKASLPDTFYLRKLPYVQRVRQFQGALYLQLGQNSIVRYDGETWREEIAGLDWGWAGTMYEADGKLYVNANYPYLYVSTDDGRSFSSAYSGVASQLESYYSTYFFSLGDYRFAWEQKLYRTSEVEEAWSAVLDDRVHALQVHGSTIWVLAGRQLYYSDNYGESWVSKYDFTPYFGAYPEYGQLVELHKNGRELIVSIGVPGDTGYLVLYSKNNGKTFEQVGNFPLTSYAAAKRELLVFTKDSTALLYSNNMGQDWVALTPPCPYPRCNIYDMEIAEDLFILMTGDGIFYSEDDGLSWAQYYPEFFDEYPCTEIFYYQGKWIGTCLIDGGGVFEFTDYPFTDKE